MFFFSLFSGFTQFKQDTLQYESFWKANTRGMIALTSWSVANISSSIALRKQVGLEGKYFNQMNGYWNVVNLALGISGIMRSHKMLHQPDFESWENDQLKLPKIYKTNFFIDFAYIGTGATLMVLSDRFKNPYLASGYGKSIIVQGAFLLVFDYVMYRVLKSKINR
ncbi:hypothetical protein CRYO30217_02103 [Parvicella tangerina]|uniref:Uncharacterized protein n=2 Tax=Parvicella tangerina TaxID=2829795 RepID=A0A916NI46_9FLAO|nr:hypothetical protein CRYO30217_02103 [Parvicella tangerina]